MENDIPIIRKLDVNELIDQKDIVELQVWAQGDSGVSVYLKTKTALSVGLGVL